MADLATFVCEQNTGEDSEQDDGFLIYLDGSPGQTQMAEVFKLTQSNKLLDCVSSLAVPLALQDSTGGVMLDQEQGSVNVIICGGVDAGSKQRDECYRLSGSDAGNNNDNMYLGSLSHSRSGADSVIMDDGKSLWVTGGRSNVEAISPLWSTEIVNLGSGSNNVVSSYGPDLPVAGLLMHHCLEKAGPKVALLIGGLLTLEDQSISLSQRTWSIDIDEMVWMELAPLATGRSNHACGVIKDRTFPDTQIVIVAGGKTSLDDGLVTNIVEQLIIEGDEKTKLNLEEFLSWRSAPAMPVSISDAATAMTGDQGKLFVVCGQTTLDRVSSSVYEIQCSDLQCQWSKSVVKPKRPSSKGLAFILPSTSPMMLRSRAEKPCFTINGNCFAA